MNRNVPLHLASVLTFHTKCVCVQDKFHFTSCTRNNRPITGGMKILTQVHKSWATFWRQHENGAVEVSLHGTNVSSYFRHSLSCSLLFAVAVLGCFSKLPNLVAVFSPTISNLFSLCCCECVVSRKSVLFCLACSVAYTPLLQGRGASVTTPSPPLG